MNIVTRPSANTVQKTRYDQITVLGIATKAKTAGELIALTTIPFRPGCAPQRKLMSVECNQISQRKECSKTGAGRARCSSQKSKCRSLAELVMTNRSDRNVSAT